MELAGKPGLVVIIVDGEEDKLLARELLEEPLRRVLRALSAETPGEGCAAGREEARVSPGCVDAWSASAEAQR